VLLLAWASIETASAGPWCDAPKARIPEIPNAVSDAGYQLTLVVDRSCSMMTMTGKPPSPWARVGKEIPGFLAADFAKTATELWVLPVPALPDAGLGNYAPGNPVRPGPGLKEADVKGLPKQFHGRG